MFDKIRNSGALVASKFVLGTISFLLKAVFCHYTWKFSLRRNICANASSENMAIRIILSNQMYYNCGDIWGNMFKTYCDFSIFVLPVYQNSKNST